MLKQHCHVLYGYNAAEHPLETWCPLKLSCRKMTYCASSRGRIEVPYFLTHSSEPRHDKTNKMAVRPAKTQISLGIHPVWSESSLSTWRTLGSLATHWEHSEDSDQTGQNPRLFWVFAKTLIRLSGCPGWSESSLGLVILFLSCRDSSYLLLLVPLSAGTAQHCCNIVNWAVKTQTQSINNQS